MKAESFLLSVLSVKEEHPGDYYLHPFNSGCTFFFKEWLRDVGRFCEPGGYASC